MLARLASTIQYIEDYFLGSARLAITNQEQLVQDELTPAAIQSTTGIAVARLGPQIPNHTRHITVMVPKSKEDLTKVLDASEADPEGRSVLDFFAEMTNGNSLANSTGSYALDVRRILVYYTGDVHGFIPIGRKEFKESLHAWSQMDDGFILLDKIKLMTRHMNAERMLGYDTELTNDENNQVNHGFKNVKLILMNPFSIWARSDFYNAKTQYLKNSNRFIEKHKDTIVQQVNHKEHSNVVSDFITWKMNKDNVSSECDASKVMEIAHKEFGGVMLLMGAMDGIYINLMGILVQLMKHPEMVEKLRLELTAKCSVDTDGYRSVSDETLRDNNQLPYLDCVIKEGLRHTSSAPLLPRFTRKGLNLDNNLIIPEHSTILINLEAMHHDKILWGDDANEFRPERFENANAPKLHEFPFMPFSVGRRKCPGSELGLRAMKMFLSDLYLNYDLQSVPNQPEPTIDKKAALVMDIGPGYKVRLKPLRKALVSNIENNYTDQNDREKRGQDLIEQLERKGSSLNI